MKKLRTLLALTLVVALIASIAAITSAEVQVEEEWRADIRTLMDEAHFPKTTAIRYDHELPEDAGAVSHAHAIEKIGSDGSTLRIDVELIATEPLADSAWDEVDAWLDETVDGAIQGIAADTESLAHVVDEAIADAQRDARRAQSDSPWASEALLVEAVTVTLPYYPELSDGDSGAETQRLQEALVRLGYLDDDADGFFGPNTQAAVESLEEYVRALEQDVIDALPTPEPTATPKPTPKPTPSPMPDPSASPDAESEPEETPEPEPTPTPEPQPTPATPVDGIADAPLQAYLYSADFKPARSALERDDRGDAVLRLQRRLIRLGCMAGAADGIYGDDTARAVRIFQHYNALEETGVADLETQNLLFSEDAKAPDHPLLTVGSSGEEVENLQLRLRVLGFMNGSVDGDFGNSTANGVRNLQQYLRDLEQQALRADTNAMAQLDEEDGDIESLLTTPVNGVADPILLDDFYADAFPAIPERMSNGTSGIDVVRLQRRLNTLEYYYGSLDGVYGNGTESALRAFQKRNGLEQSGIAGDDTLELLFSEDALKALKPYVLKISIADQRVYAYGLDDNNEHTVLVRTMKCSTGKDATPTPKGTFQSGTGPGARWYYFKKFDCWAQYAYYIEGDILFHSVLYNEKGGAVTQSSVNNLGRKASHGCVRLSVEDAKWIYNNCPVNTKVVVY